jgi:RNase H-like domain found in reverse transcriptase
MTDASDYGVGGHLYQLIDGVKQLVALVSKALTIVQLNGQLFKKMLTLFTFAVQHLINNYEIEKLRL